MSSVLSRTASENSFVTREQARELIAQACPAKDYRGKKILFIVPDATRTCPLGVLFEGMFDQVGEATAAMDVMIALGTHQPMSEEAICERLDITMEERQGKYRSVRFFNHEWDNPAALRRVGDLTLEDTRELTGGLFEMEVPVNINAKLFEYDQLVIMGPVFPHEVVGFSGGNKYLFPGVSGAEVLNFFHWLGAVVTNPMIIGNKWRGNNERTADGKQAVQTSAHGQDRLSDFRCTHPSRSSRTKEITSKRAAKLCAAG